MDITQTRRHVFLAPRPFKVVIYQFFGSLFLLISFLMLIPTIVSVINWSAKDALIGSFLFVPPLLLGIAIVFLTQQHIVRVVVDKEHSLLIIKKKGCPDEEHDLRTIDRLVSTEVLAMPGFIRIKLCTETHDGTYTSLLSDDIVCFTRSWSHFGRKLATLTNKPLRKDYLVEDLDGRLVKNKLK
jgi:hypothetical protein